MALFPESDYILCRKCKKIMYPDIIFDVKTMTSRIAKICGECERKLGINQMSIDYDEWLNNKPEFLIYPKNNQNKLKQEVMKNVRR